MERTKFKTLEQEENNTFTYFTQEEPIVLSKLLLDLLLKEKDPSSLVALYTFYYYTAKWQHTNQPKATDRFSMQGLGIGYSKLYKAQKKLIELGLIEKICKKDSSGKIRGWFIKINFVWSIDTINKKFVRGYPLEFEMSSSPDYVWKDFEDMKRKGLHLKIYERDGWKCIYCNEKVIEVKALFDSGMDRADIADYIRSNPTKIATIDHLIPLVAGGTNDEDNLATSCLFCNSSKGSKQDYRFDRKPELSKTRSGFQERNSLNSNNEYIPAVAGEADVKVVKVVDPITKTMFEKFWKIYPRKVDKGKALTIWNRICARPGKDRPTWKQIKLSILRQGKSERWQDPKFIPHPSTWLNQNRWLDDPGEMSGAFSSTDSQFIIDDGIKYIKGEDGRYRNASGTVYIP